ncbi:MAG: ABC transporter permease [Pseudomonadales bacterium]
MNNDVVQIEWLEIGIALLPMVLVMIILFRWSARGWTAIYSTARMLIQLIVIGYFLVFIFDATDAWVICLVLLVMLLVASWIALSPVSESRRQLYTRVLVALTIGGGLTLFTITWGVLHLSPWYEPRYMVPLAGMIFANSMNTVSLSAERFAAEVSHGEPIDAAKHIALQSGMIPVINSMFAVGLVALPGMMTGQILSGVSPLIASRYQIVVMAMLFAASGLSAAIYLQLVSQLVRTEKANGL